MFVSEGHSHGWLVLLTNFANEMVADTLFPIGILDKEETVWLV